MIYKLKLIFKEPMALAHAPMLGRIKLAVIHAGLGACFLLDPYKVIVGSVLASILLYVMRMKKSAYMEEHISFALQRCALAFVSMVVFLALHAEGTVNNTTWYFVSKVACLFYVYDAYLAYNGIKGLFFINFKKILNKNNK